MRIEQKRIFISDLPETATQSELKNALQVYGEVLSIEIKERKELGPKNKSLFFAYVNIKIDDRNLQKCFKDFANTKWHNQYVQLKIARENFLERLKREREEQSIADSKKEVILDRVFVNNNENKEDKLIKFSKTKLEKTNEFGTENSTNNIYNKNNEKIINTDTNVKAYKKVETGRYSSSESSDESIKGIENKSKVEYSDIVIKNNKGKIIDSKGLKIESVGKEPILKIEKQNVKHKSQNKSDAELKRQKSIKQMKQGYENQKSIISAALSRVDTQVKSQKDFNEDIATQGSNNRIDQQNKKRQSKTALFDDEDDEFEGNFEIKEQFQGKEGQKLLKLQSTYKNDKRFALNSKFLEDSKEKETTNVNEDTNELSLEQEKQKQFEILEEVLGKKVKTKSATDEKLDSKKKSMLRFDPTQPEHSKYLVKNEEAKQISPSKKKKRKTDFELENFEEKKRVEPEEPEVSKEIFYKVTDNLKETLGEKKEFSLLNLYGQTHPEQDKDEANEVTEEPAQSGKNMFFIDQNPFKYDSSDDEDTPSLDKAQKLEENKSKPNPISSKTNNLRFWSEPFFFKKDDYRLQEGFDFIEKMGIDEKTEFSKLRRNVKEIVRAKVRNNQRKNKPFKKKLGGNKRRKMLRLKKAMKR